MPISARFPCGRSQQFTFARRNFLQGLVSAILPFISQPQPAISAFGRCRPEFSIGDKVQSSWEAEPGVFRSENGEIVGICWHPTKRQWEYLIIWAGCNFDEYLTSSRDLELNHHA
jgi:hypothetical protein